MKLTKQAGIALHGLCSALPSSSADSCRWSQALSAGARSTKLSRQEPRRKRPHKQTPSSDLGVPRAGWIHKRTRLKSSSSQHQTARHVRRCGPSPLLSRAVTTAQCGSPKWTAQLTVRLPPAIVCGVFRRSLPSTTARRSEGRSAPILLANSRSCSYQRNREAASGDGFLRWRGTCASALRRCSVLLRLQHPHPFSGPSPSSPSYSPHGISFDHDRHSSHCPGCPTRRPRYLGCGPGLSGEDIRLASPSAAVTIVVTAQVHRSTEGSSHH
jgi:hypothetical protein